MRKAPKHQPIVCLSCPRHIRKQDLHRITFAIAAPMVEHTTPVLGAVLCPKCAADPDHGMAKAMAGIRRMMPGAQPIIVHPNGGQA